MAELFVVLDVTVAVENITYPAGARVPLQAAIAAGAISAADAKRMIGPSPRNASAPGRVTR